MRFHSKFCLLLFKTVNEKMCLSYFRYKSQCNYEALRRKFKKGEDILSSSTLAKERVKRLLPILDPTDDRPMLGICAGCRGKLKKILDQKGAFDLMSLSSFHEGHGHHLARLAHAKFAKLIHQLNCRPAAAKPKSKQGNPTKRRSRTSAQNIRDADTNATLLQ